MFVDTKLDGERFDDVGADPCDSIGQCGVSGRRERERLRCELSVGAGEDSGVGGAEELSVGRGAGAEILRTHVSEARRGAPAPGWVGFMGNCAKLCFLRYGHMRACRYA